MVNNTNISAYKGTPPASFQGDNRHYIERGPIYRPQEIKNALHNGETALNLWTRKCVKDVQTRLELDMSDVLALLKIISNGKGTYLKSEWCVQKPTGPWAACDGYTVVREEWRDNLKRYDDVRYYVKFAINKSGKLLLIVSCHE